MSNSIVSILNYYFDPKAFALGAKSLLSEAQENTISNAKKRLDTISKNCIVKDDKSPSIDLIDSTYRKYHAHYRNLEYLDLSTRELRALLYTMHRFTTPEMECFIDLLRSRWRNRFFSGLQYYILSSWDSDDKDNLSMAIELLKEKLQAYDGKRDKYIIMRNSLLFLEDNGPEMLGLTLRRIDGKQSKYCSLFTMPSVYFGIQSNRLDLEYYSRVIVAYFEKDALSKVNLLKEVLEKHNYDNTPKRIIPSLIIKYDDNHSEGNIDKLRTLAISFIGNPDIPARWTMQNASAEERYNLEKSRDILQKWIKREFLSIFFEKCVHEISRKEYWLENISLIDDLQVCCTEMTMSILQQDSRIKEILDYKTNVMTNEVEADKSALILTIGHYYIIEFSDVGSIYIYDQSSLLGRTLHIKGATYFSDLKHPRLETLQSFNLDRLGEGKLLHVDGWQRNLDKWFSLHRVKSVY